MNSNLLILLLSSFLLWLFGYFWDSAPPAMLDFTVGAYDKEFWKNCLINLHSSIVDFLILTLIAGFFVKRFEEAQKEAERDKLEERRRTAALQARRQKVEDELRILEEQRIVQHLEMDTADAGVKFEARPEAVVAMRRLVELKEEGFDASQLNFSRIALPKAAALVDVNLSDCTFRKAALAQTVFRNCLMKRADFSSSEEDGKAAQVTLEGAEFHAGSWDKANFQRAKLSRVRFHRCELVKVDFSYANLKTAEFNYCSFKSVIFSESELAGAQFRGTWPAWEQLKRAASIYPMRINDRLCESEEDLLAAMTAEAPREGVEPPQAN